MNNVLIGMRSQWQIHNTMKAQDVIDNNLIHDLIKQKTREKQKYENNVV